MRTIRAKNKLGLVFFPAFDWAIHASHPEREERLLYTQDQIFEEGLEDIEGIHFYNPVMATEKDIARVHVCVPQISSLVTHSHLISAGGCITGLEKVMKGEVDKAFALVRPPGHHAMRIVHGSRGFCTINIEAVMLEKIRQVFGPLRAAIIDTDCHHGDGTQDIYWNDADTLFISLHQDGRALYPGTGFLDEFGGPGAYGYNINIPLPPGSGEEGFLYTLDNLIIPIIEEFKPDIIINSAGQDNHYTDPLTNMKFTAQGYAKLTEKLNPDIAVLEGGYSIEGGLPYVNVGIILALAGVDYSQVVEPDYYEQNLRQEKEITQYISQLCDETYTYWQEREKLQRESFQGLEYYQRERRIFYDTDGILENQQEKFKICPRCSGVNTIASQSDQGEDILAIMIPRQACSTCIDEGYGLWEDQEGNYRRIYLQDRVNDHFLTK